MFIAVDIGATNTRVASFSSPDPNSLVKLEKFATPQEYSELYDQLTDTIAQLAEGQQIEKITIGSAGWVSPDHKIILKNAFLPAIVNKPIVDALEHEFRTAVLLNNDAVCSAVGESYLGVGKYGKRVLFITLSTGMGGSFVKKDGNITYIIPAEIGHTIVDLHGKVCECGQKGCIGAYAHGRGLEERFLTKPENIDDMRVWEEVAEYLTIGVINGARIFLPDTVVFSGALIDSRDYLFEKIQQLYEKRSVIRPLPNMVRSEFGDHSVMYGSLAFLTIQNAVFI